MTPTDGLRVSILIPVWNGEHSIGDALTSAAVQTLGDLEIIVIDDASQDGTAARVREFAASDARVRLVDLQSNGGPGAARTAGLREAEGDWIAILDADDRFEADRLERLVAEAERDGLDAIADNLALVDPGLGKAVGRAFPLSPGDHVDLDVETFLDNVRPGARVNLGWMQPVVRRDFLVRNGLEWPAIRHAEDMVFTMRMLCHHARFRLIGEALYRYTQRVGTVSGHRSGLSRTRRSIEEQHRALDLILSECRSSVVSAASLRRLNRMRSEIEATTDALFLRDAVSDRDFSSAAGHFLRTIARPAALSRCFWQRYAVGNRLRTGGER